MSNLQGKGKLPASSDSSPGALPISTPRPPPAAEEPKKWHGRRLFRVLLAVSCLLTILVVVGVVALVMYLTKPAEVTAPPTSEAALQIACNFLSIQDLTECRSTVKFATWDGNDITSSTIPSEIALLSQLTYLDVSYNQLTGTIPTEMGLMHQLMVLVFFDNLLTGTIPSEIGELTQLMDLYFNNNDLLLGTMPSSLCSLLPSISMVLRLTVVT